MNYETYKLIKFATLLHKYSQSEKLLNRLIQLNISEEVKNFIINLDPKLHGIALGVIAKNNNANIDDIQSEINKKITIEHLKQKTQESFEKDLPKIESDKIKFWIINQIKKNPNNKNLLLNRLNDIMLFIKETDINIESYDTEQLINFMDQYQEKSPRLGDNNDISFYINKMLEVGFNKLKLLNNDKLKVWAKIKFIEQSKETKKNIEKAIKFGSSFQHLLNQAHEISKKLENGEFRGQQIPNTPIRNGEYERLIDNIEFLNDWANNANIDFSNMSLDEVIESSNQWHKELVESGKGLTYDPIDRNNIVYGPNNWANKENNGFFILELKSANDLKVEGFKQKHCVGGYWDKIKDNKCRIFSLRNSNNIFYPILTIETDMSGIIVRQDYGPKNKKIEQKYHDMVSEWTSKNSGNISKMNSQDLLILARNPNTSVEILQQLAGDKSPNVRARVARNPNTPVEILQQLAGDEDFDVRKAIAKNPNTPVEILQQLAGSESSDVKWRVAENPNTPVEILQQLAGDKSIVVREAVAGNPNTPVKILQQLAGDRAEYVALSAKKKLKEKNKIANNKYNKIIKLANYYYSYSLHK